MPDDIEGFNTELSDLTDNDLTNVPPSVKNITGLLVMFAWERIIMLMGCSSKTEFKQARQTPTPL